MTNDINKIFENNPELQKKIFSMGFVATNSELKESNYPFYGNWNVYKVNSLNIYVHPFQRCYIYQNKILIGHAYNPFTMETDENLILKLLSEENLNQLTGIFTIIEVTEHEVKVVGDATCMQCTYYGIIDDHYYITTHPNLIGDLLDLEWDSYIQELVSYRFFKLFGIQLPGNLSEYKELKRLLPNHYAVITNNKIEIKRFHWPHSFDLILEELTENASRLMHNNLELISKKWKKPAISLTGGCDSKTTLACANGIYDRFQYFSYISSLEEEVDAKAAHHICQALCLNHDIYEIPKNDCEIEDIENIRELLFHNCGRMRKNNKNDVRKRAWFAERNLFDVEVKSWASEIGRAYYSKRFAKRKDFGEYPTSRKCSTLYKIFLSNRRLLRKTDQVFEDYLTKYFEQSEINSLPWQEQFFWEHRMAAWNALVITHEHRYSYDITIPYNNRILLEYFLSVPLEDRINDVLYQVIRKKMNPKIDATNISVQNVKHTQNRAVIENLYYLFNSRKK